jgi:hypothetical protein
MPQGCQNAGQDRLTHFNGWTALAVVVVIAFLFLKAGLDAFNSWLFPPLEINFPPEMRQ